MATRKPTGDKTAVQIGPLNGGLNNVSTAGEARDTEVVDLVNLEVTLDESLTSRPPVEAMAGSTLPSTNTIGWEVLGIYRVASDEFYLIVTTPTDGSTNVNTTVKAYLNGIVGAGETITTIKNCTGIINRITSMVQFKDDLYFNVNEGATDRGFHWKKGEATGGTTVSTMPRGSVLISWKTRLWVSGSGVAANGDRVYFSTIDATGPHPDTWGANDNFDIEPGQGGFITAMLPSFNNLIIFKNDGTWRWSFPSSPLQGQVDQVSGAVGAAGKNAVVSFENYMYVYDQGRVYELVNSSYTQVNRFVKFAEDTMGVDSVAPSIDLSVVNRRLLVRYFNAVYSFNVDTKAWSQWRSYSGTPGKFYELPADSNQADASIFIAASRGTSQSVSPNMIVDSDFSDVTINEARSAVAGGTVTILGDDLTLETLATAKVLLNDSGVITDFQFPVSTSQQFQFDFNVSFINGTAVADIIYLLRDGTTSTSSSANITTTGAKSFSFTAPSGAILCIAAIRMSTAGSVTFDDPTFFRKAATAPFNLIKITDQYPDQAAAVEYIDCYLQTKSYDYKTPANFKRLYWGGIDIKSFRKVQTECRPVSTVAPILWGDLEGYTHQELEQGVWGNPLSWLNISFAVFTNLEADEVMSENGRYFKKIGESIRFRQISYRIRTTSLGNLATGPVKFFSLTTFIGVKQEVVDSST